MAKIKQERKIFMNGNKSKNGDGQKRKFSGDKGKKNKDGKKPRQIDAKTKAQIRTARGAFKTGEVDASELERRTKQNARTLYIRFTGESLPSSHDEIKNLHSDVKFVRTPRQASRDKAVFKYAFLEFGSEEECKKAKNKLSTTRFGGAEIFVDYVGDKSRSAPKKEEKKDRLNPCRLFVCGLAPGVRKEALKGMFPKCSNAEIPPSSVKKGTPFGFVQFSNPADAKAAFDAAQGLDIDGHKITVLYSKITGEKAQVVKKKSEKRKQKRDEKKEKAKKPRLEKEDSSDEDEVKFKEKAGKVVKNSAKIVKNAGKAEDKNAGKDEEDDDDEDDENDLDTEEGDEEEKVESETVVSEDDDEEDDEEDEDDDDDEEEEEEGSENKTEAAEVENDDDDDDEDDENDLDSGEEDEKDGKEDAEVADEKKDDDDDEDDDDDDDDEESS